MKNGRGGLKMRSIGVVQCNSQAYLSHNIGRFHMAISGISFCSHAKVCLAFDEKRMLNGASVVDFRI